MATLEEQIDFATKKKEDLQKQMEISSKPHPDDWIEMLMYRDIEESLFRLHGLLK